MSGEGFEAFTLLVPSAQESSCYDIISLFDDVASSHILTRHIPNILPQETMDWGDDEQHARQWYGALIHSWSQSKTDH